METVKKLSFIFILFGMGTVIGSWIVAENVSKQIKEKEELTPEQIVASFYGKWKADQNPFSEEFHTFKMDISDNFKNFLAEFSEDFDPVVCSDEFPSNYSLGPAEIKGDKAVVPFNGINNAIVSLKMENNRWLIDSVVCNQ